MHTFWRNLWSCHKIYCKYKIFLMAVYLIFKYGNDSAALHRLIMYNFTEFLHSDTSTTHSSKNFFLNVWFHCSVRFEDTYYNLECYLYWNNFRRSILYKVKRIVKGLGYRLHPHLSKFDRSVFLVLMPISNFFGVYMAWVFI